jgi:hypothetical protein
VTLGLIKNEGLTERISESAIRSKKAPEVRGLFLVGRRELDPMLHPFKPTEKTRVPGKTDASGKPAPRKATQ